jgi:hypothetical protein
MGAAVLLLKSVFISVVNISFSVTERYQRHGEIGLAADEVAHIGSCESSDPLR